MIRRPPSDAADETLDQALSLARTPTVPADLAARIVAQVTELPQPAADEKSLPQASDERSGRKRALAAALGAIVVIGGAALFGLWPSGHSPTADRPILAASSDKSGEPVLAVNSGDGPARAEPETGLRAVAPKTRENAGTEVAAPADRAPEPTPEVAAPSSEPAVPTAPDEETAPQTRVELAEQSSKPASNAADPAVEIAVVPAVPSGGDSNSGTTINTIPGLPPPQGLGITGNPPAPPAPAAKSGPVGRRAPPPRR